MISQCLGVSPPWICHADLLGAFRWRGHSWAAASGERPASASLKNGWHPAIRNLVRMMKWFFLWQCERDGGVIFTLKFVFGRPATKDSFCILKNCILWILWIKSEWVDQPHPKLRHADRIAREVQILRRGTLGRRRMVEPMEPMKASLIRRVLEADDDRKSMIHRTKPRELSAQTWSFSSWDGHRWTGSLTLGHPATIPRWWDRCNLAKKTGVDRWKRLTYWRTDSWTCLMRWEKSWNLTWILRRSHLQYLQSSSFCWKQPEILAVRWPHVRREFRTDGGRVGPSARGICATFRFRRARRKNMVIPRDVRCVRWIPCSAKGAL